jgi:hypothetical protein
MSQHEDVISNLPPTCMQALPWLSQIIINNNNKHKAAAHAEKGSWRAWLAVACSLFDDLIVFPTHGHKESRAR